MDLFFNIAPISDHVAKFRGDRQRDRGDLVLNKKKKKERNSSEISGPRLRYHATGGPNKIASRFQEPAVSVAIGMKMCVAVFEFAMSAVTKSI